MEEDGTRERSFRYEDYNTRRVFLRSYPLHWGGDEESSVEAESRAAPAKASQDKPTKGKKQIRKIIVAVVQWGEERILVFRRFKHNVTFYVVNCVPVNFKVPTALISIK